MISTSRRSEDDQADDRPARPPVRSENGRPSAITPLTGTGSPGVRGPDVVVSPSTESRLSCRLVHTIPGRIRVRIENETVFGDLRPAFEEFLCEQPGMLGVRINPHCRSVVLHYETQTWNADGLLDLLYGVSLDELRERQSGRTAASDGDEDEAGSVMSALSLGLSTASLVAGGLGLSAVAPWLLAASAVPLFRRAIDAVAHQRRLNVDVLDASATTVLAMRGQFGAGSVLVWLVSLGDFIRDVTKQHSEQAISDLFDADAQTAWLVEGDDKREVKVSELQVSDELVVYAGELVPADGTVVRGRANVDQASLTGESVPADICKGDEVFAGTVVRDGKIYLRAERVGTETVAARVVRMVREAPARETRIQNYAERFADRIVPWSFAGAAACLLLRRNAGMAASILIADYGTGIRVAAPTTILSSMARAARQGILIKGGGRYLEILSEIDTIVFDKTGTLTYGTPRLTDIAVYGGGRTRERVLALAAAAEQRLTHPVAEAIEAAAAERGIVVPDRETSDYTIGLGVEAQIEGSRVLVGCQRFLESKGVSLDVARQDLEEFRSRAAIAVFVAVEGKLAGLLALADPLRPEARDVVQALHARGVRQIVMVTGDSRPAARRVAEVLGIDRYIAEVMPEDKAKFVAELQREGRTVAVVGDGVNDSPALAQADVGIAVHGGSDIAGETAHLMLRDSSLRKLPESIDLARDAVRLIEQNWHLNLYPNTAALALSLLSVIGPVGATLISNGAAVLSTLNGLRPLLGNRLPRLLPR